MTLKHYCCTGSKRRTRVLFAVLPYMIRYIYKTVDSYIASCNMFAKHFSAPIYLARVNSSQKAKTLTYKN